MTEHDHVTNDFLQAAGLLEADLVWSPDFESLREPLAKYLRIKSGLGTANNPYLREIVARLLREENDLGI
jgi:hypothetical protein